MSYGTAGVTAGHPPRLGRCASSTAEVLTEVDPARLEPYRAKYERHMRERLNWEPTAMLARHSAALRMTPTRWRRN